jgi:hypothetical protein
MHGEGLGQRIGKRLARGDAGCKKESEKREKGLRIHIFILKQNWQKG